VREEGEGGGGELTVEYDYDEEGFEVWVYG
jgi:hypothetical protein